MALIRIQGSGSSGTYNAAGGELLVSAVGTGDVTISLNGVTGDFTHTLGSGETAHQFNVRLSSGDIIQCADTNAVTIETEGNYTKTN